MGQYLRLECSSDLDVKLIEWFKNGMKIATSSTSSSSSFLHGQVSTDDEGLQYTCRVTSPYAVQEKNITFSVMGKLTSINSRNAMHLVVFVCMVRAVQLLVDSSCS